MTNKIINLQRALRIMQFYQFKDEIMVIFLGSLQISWVMDENEINANKFSVINIGEVWELFLTMYNNIFIYCWIIRGLNQSAQSLIFFFKFLRVRLIGKIFVLPQCGLILYLPYTHLVAVKTLFTFLTLVLTAMSSANW